MRRLLLTIALLTAIASGAPQQNTSGRVICTTPRGKIVKLVRPEYPAEARQQHVQGLVSFRCLLSRDGSMKRIEVIQGHPLLVPAAKEAIRQWRYEPIRVNGRAVEFETQINVNFKLPVKGKKAK